MEQSCSCHSHSIVSPILNKTTCKGRKILFPLTQVNTISLKTHTTSEPFWLIILPFFILDQWQSKKGGTNKAEITQTWSCSNSIIRNDEVSGPSPLLLWAGSSLCWDLPLQRVFSYITGFFMSNLGAGIVEKRRVFRGCWLWLCHEAPSHFHWAHFPSEPLGCSVESYWLWNWNGDCFLSETLRWSKIPGWNFPQQIQKSRKEKKFKPIHQAALLSHPCPSASRWMLRIFMVKIHWPSSSSAPPFCPTDPKFCVLLLKSLWIPVFHPFLLKPNLSGAAESEDILKERHWEVFAMKTRSDWSLLQSQTCWADKGILIPENWWDFSKYAKMKYPVFFDT